mgnify:CR=1 FL=1
MQDLNRSALAAQAGAGGKKAIQQINKINKETGRELKRVVGAKPVERKPGVVSTPMTESLDDWKQCQIQILK